jgi:cell division protein ZapA
MSSQTLDVKILDRDLRVACRKEEREDLMASVNYLNRKMTEIRDSGKILNVERIAIMAALNMAHELLAMKVGKGIDLADLTRRMNAMQESIDQALAEQVALF